MSLNEDGWTALMIAAMKGHTETAKALIAAGADVSAKDEDGQTALLFAARRPRWRVVMPPRMTLLLLICDSVSSTS